MQILRSVDYSLKYIETCRCRESTEISRSRWNCAKCPIIRAWWWPLRLPISRVINNLTEAKLQKKMARKLGTSRPRRNG